MIRKLVLLNLYQDDYGYHNYVVQKYGAKLQIIFVFMNMKTLTTEESLGTRLWQTKGYTSRKRKYF